MVSLPTPNPRKTTSFRELGPVDIAELKQAVAAISDAQWGAANASKPNKFDALDKTEHIIFRFVSSLADWRQAYEGPLWSQWRAKLEPVLAAAVAPYGYANGVFPRVMLARMAPGGVILPHQDTMPAAKWPHKVHVPLFTNEQVMFRCGDEYRHLKEGVAVEVNNMGVHAVKNEGDASRTHLIFEYYDADQPEPDWLEAVVAAAKTRQLQSQPS